MPDPIRTTLILPPALLDDEHVSESKADGPSAPFEPLPLLGLAFRSAGAEIATGGRGGSVLAALADSSVETDTPTSVGGPPLGIPFKRDPYGRDGSSSTRRLETRHGWSVEPLAKYLKGVAVQIDTNLRDECVPSAERFEAFVSRLVSHTKKQLKHAPRKDRHNLQALFSTRFQKFWDFAQNQKVRTTSPEELKVALVTLVENLFVEFAGSPDTFLLAPPPKPLCRRRTLSERILA